MRGHPKASLFLGVFLVLLTIPNESLAGSLLTTTTDGHLVFEAIEGHGATSTQEFGLGTPAMDSTPSERQRIFTIHLVNEQIESVTPTPIVDMGFFPAGTALDFYNLSDFNGVHWAFSEHLGSNPSAPDLEVFADRDNSLGFGQSVVEILGVDEWILHLDDAASVDDDDNEMVIRVRVERVPEPSVLLLVVLAGPGLSLRVMRQAAARARRNG
jgi:hypothetical protein